MQKLEQCTKEVILKPGRLEIHHGRPDLDPDAVDFKRLIIHAALSKGTRLVERQFSFRCLPNGDWWGYIMKVFVPIGIVVDAASIAELIASSLAVLIGRFNMPILDMGRWRGAVQTLARIVLGML